MAGQWVNKPEQAFVPGQKHLQCLDQERQGNCHDPDLWMKTNDPARLSRHNSLLKGAVSNSPGILNASDPWVWQSNVPRYEVIPYNKGEHEQYRKQTSAVLSNRTIFLVGDSLTRQWSQVMRCEIMDVLGKSKEATNEMVRILPMHTDFDNKLFKKRYGDPFPRATERDVIVFNFGHHVGNKLGVDWQPKYIKVLKDALEQIDFGKIPDDHVLFRTTTVRNFLRNEGDWNTNSSKAGGSKPNIQAVWINYGGNLPEQPTQNLLAFDTILRDTRSGLKILDTSPMMLARGDASFDGSHICIPGPMTYWSRMLYYQIQ